MANNQLDDIETLVELFDTSDWQELSLHVDDLRLFLSKDAAAKGLQETTQNKQSSHATSSTAAPEKQPSATQPPPEKHIQDEVPDTWVAVRAANVGTFYRAPKPGEPAYVEVGDSVTVETEVCLIEVMKLFTPQQAGVAGSVQKICVKDAQMVEYDQPLFYIEPSE